MGTVEYLPDVETPATTTVFRAAVSGLWASAFRCLSRALALDSWSTLKACSLSPGTFGMNRRLPAANTKRS